MSGSAPPPVAPSAEPYWAKPSIGIYTLVLFLAALAVSWWLKDNTAFDLMIGATIANANTVIGYYFGSSSGSEKKDEIIRQQGTPR